MNATLPAGWNLFCDFFTRLWVAERADGSARYRAGRREQVIWLAARHDAAR